MRFLLLFIISMSIVCCAVEAGCKGTKCHKRRKDDQGAKNQDNNDPLEKVEDMEAKKKEKPKSEEESEEEEEKKKPEEVAAARVRRAENELRRQKELSQEQDDGLASHHRRKHSHDHRRHVTGYEHTHSKEEGEPVGDIKDANVMEHNSPQRVRRAHRMQDLDTMDDEDNELDFKNLKNQWKKNYVPNSLPKQVKEAMKEGKSRQKKHLDRKVDHEQEFVGEPEKLQLNMEDIALQDAIKEPYPSTTMRISQI